MNAQSTPENRSKDQKVSEKVDLTAFVAIKVNAVTALHLSHSRIKNQPMFNKWIHVQDYCMRLLALEPVEHFVILYPDNQDRLIVEETMSIGTIDQTAIYPSKVVNAVSKKTCAIGDSFTKSSKWRVETVTRILRSLVIWKICSRSWK